MSEYTYSIVIPHHNIPDLLKRCLCSIPQREDIQVIVIDDNSSIENLEKVKNIEKDFSHVSFIYDSRGKGAGAARNLGLEKAKGKWILFVDSDDFLTEDAFSIIDQYKSTDYDIIYFKIKSVYSDNLTPSEREKEFSASVDELKSDKDKLTFWLKYKFTEPWSKLIRLSLLRENNIQFQESFVANDYYFSVASGYFARNIHFDHYPIYVYTDRRDSLSKDIWSNPAKVGSRLSVYFEVEKFAKRNEIYISPFSFWGLSTIIHSNLRIPYKRICKEKGVSYYKCLFSSLLIRSNLSFST